MKKYSFFLAGRREAVGSFYGLESRPCIMRIVREDLSSARIKLISIPCQEQSRMAQCVIFKKTSRENNINIFIYTEM